MDIPGKWEHKYATVVRFLAQDVIYTSRAYATMSVSVCLSVCDVYALWSQGCHGSWIPLHAWMDVFATY